MANVQFNLRLPEERVDALKVVAEVEGVSPRELVLEAIDLVLSKRRNDPEWLERLNEREGALRQAFDRLRASEVGSMVCGWIVWGPMRAYCADCATERHVKGLHPDWRVVPVIGAEAQGVTCERCGRALTHLLQGEAKKVGE